MNTATMDDVLPSDQPIDNNSDVFQTPHGSLGRDMDVMAGLDSTSQLMKTKVELEAASEKLLQTRKEHIERMEQLSDRTAQLALQKSQLTTRKEKFEKFLRENEAKKQRAEIKCVAERKLRDAKTEELKQLNMQLDEQKAERTRLSSKIDKWKCYEAYLQSVAETLPIGFTDSSDPSISDIIARHATLSDTHIELTENLSNLLETVDVMRTKVSDTVNGRLTSRVMLNAQLQNTQKQLEVYRHDNLTGEQESLTAQHTSRAKVLDFITMKMAILNLVDKTHPPPSSWCIQPNSKSAHELSKQRDPNTASTSKHQVEAVDYATVDLSHCMNTIRERLDDYNTTVSKAKEAIRQDCILKKNAGKLNVSGVKPKSASTVVRASSAYENSGISTRRESLAASVSSRSSY